MCTPISAEYLTDDGHWTPHYLDATGTNHTLHTLFLPTAHGAIRALGASAWRSHLDTLLNGRVLHLFLNCDGFESCVTFTLGWAFT